MLDYDCGNICPVCASKDITNFIDFKNSHQFITAYKPFKMQKDICNNCGHIYVSSCHDYDIEGHYSTARGRGDLIYAQASQIVQDEYHDLVNWLSDSIAMPDKVLDMGCGKCELLNAFKQKYSASDVFGIDYSEDSIEYGKRFNIDTIFAGDLYTDSPHISDFDVVAATNVLEHQYSLSKFLNRMKYLANDNASFLIQVPHSYSIIERKDLGSKYMHDLFNDEHVHHFNIENLSNVLIANGFEVIKHRTNRRNDWDLIDILFRVNNSNRNNGITFQDQGKTQQLIKYFNQKRAQDKSALNELVGNNAAVGIYGGGWHTDVCLPSYYDFDFSDVKVIFDLDERKQGKKLLGVEVVEPTSEVMNTLDLIIISSINLNDDIYKYLLNLGVSEHKIINLY
ncbi:methyltransferase domain-containing protein [Gammaproteobacteria bacterium]|jgi:hypothetical protein|nr:methyltransferase domain-containing protein [Gammaproteobacteria bacterium]MDC0129900.1 methyltransferase domain-containing protein [Gammaproteobacteria bacterium]